MNNRLCRSALFAALLLTATGASAQDTPVYTTAQVVSIDPAARIMVIRNTKGQRQSLMFDDLLGSTGGVKAGDRVIVTVRGGPGRERVSAIAMASATAAPTPVPRVTPAMPPAELARIKEGFARQVGVISANAASVDGSWASFVTSCKVIKAENTGGGRDWFGLWDNRIQADYTSGFCRDLFNQMISSGEAIKKAMAAAESTVTGILEPGEIRDIRSLHNMNWDGWNLAPPARREP
jgi:hypothetical protein